ncbi:MAG: enoyl-CoA hydratase/isomerase family protein [Cohaesibacter sp.]|nr:enoyl-CoA hydratase/isomerase family protein [Cohaesibacter sp.]
MQECDSHIHLSIDAGIARLTLNRPDKMNALSFDMICDLSAACQQIERDPSIGVVLLSGAGEHFCAGGDIKDWGQYQARDFAMSWLRAGHEAFDALARLRQPVIALLHGSVFGGGLELAACADLRVARQDTRLALPETGIGVIPGWSGTQRLTRRFSPSSVRRMALFGETFEAEQAHKLGFVDHVASVGEVAKLADKWAERCLRRGPTALELCKMLINAAEHEERDRPVEAMAGMAIAATQEYSEGVAAFKDKRRPVFRRSDSASYSDPGTHSDSA